MTLSKILGNVTSITDNDAINLENYMESINFVSEIYAFVNKLKLIVPMNEVTFKPSFKGRLTCEKFNINTSSKESEMKYFEIRIEKFLEDKENIKEMIRDILGPHCETIEFDNEDIRITLK